MTDKKTYSDPSRQGGSRPSDEGHSSEHDREKNLGSRHEDDRSKRSPGSSSPSGSPGSEKDRQR